MDGIAVDARAQQRVDLVVGVLIGGTDPRVAEERCRNPLRAPFTDIDFRHELSTAPTCGSVIGPVTVDRRPLFDTEMTDPVTA
ncbi:hypothetical protein [Nonomuraea mesophila]|uniref:hypothetical protein n=1 Tax=Nonomuraea mesophila TaxID=2530382 RepID=UPI001409A05B|nr:hypothetical protein [Nonomuraea mesophila]